MIDRKREPAPRRAHAREVRRDNGTGSLRRRERLAKRRNYSGHRRAQARIAFLRSVGEHAPEAIRELYRWRGRDADDEGFWRGQVLPDSRLTPDHYHYVTAWIHTSQALRGEIENPAYEERTGQAHAWAQQWHLEADWVQRWATWALVRWAVARACSRPTCPEGCAAVNNESSALDLVVGMDGMLGVVESQHREPFEVRVEDLSSFQVGGLPIEELPLWQREIAPPVAGPHPLRETEKHAVERMRRAYRDAVVSVKSAGFSVKDKSSLRLHCDWLVLQQLRGPKARKDICDRRGVTRFALSHALSALSELLDLPLRAR